MSQKTIRYLLVGGVVYIFELVVIVVAQNMGYTPTQSVAVSFLLGLAASFLLQKFFTFGDKRTHRKVVFTQVLAVLLLVLFNFAFTILLTDLLQNVLPPTVTRTIALLITTSWNFYLYKTSIFNPESPKKIRAERPSLLIGGLRKPTALTEYSVNSDEITPPPAKTTLDHDSSRSLAILIVAALLILGLVVASNIDLSHVSFTTQKKFRQTQQRAGKKALPPRPAPITIEGVTSQGCVGNTMLNIVAHYDDDLLFINPDIINDLSAGRCVRTVYLTASDHGWGRNYAADREQGVRAAYASMLGVPVEWQGHGTMLTGDETVNVDKPADSNKVEIYYFRLPDGGTDGAGFTATGNNSLLQLLADEQKVLVALDESGRYTHRTLVEALSRLIATYQPLEVRTLSGSETGGDHSDHKSAGLFAAEAIKMYRSVYKDHAAIKFRRYMGYPITSLSPNISPLEQRSKEDAFFAYAAYDHDVCKNMSECLAGDSSYGKYVSRRYEAKTPQL